MLVGNNELATTKNAGKLLAILIDMPIEHIQGFTRSH
jgi:hypothetical protein